MILTLALTAALVAVHRPAPVAHVGPPIWCELSVEDSVLRFTLSGEPEALVQLLGEPVDLVGPLEPAAVARARRLFAALLEQVDPLSVAGQPVAGELVEVELPQDEHVGGGWLVVHARWTARLEQPPSSVGVRWSRYEGSTWQGRELIPLTVLCGRRVCDQAVLTPGEPEFVWHPSPAERAGRARDIPALVVEPEPAPLRVPALSIAVAAAAVGLFFCFRRGASRRPLAAATAFAGLLVAAGLRDVGTLELRSSSARVVALPGRDRALAIFETLHRGLYDAFTAGTEEEIYDLLAASVDRSLLDDLYGEIYESLILRDQGGAVCSIEGVDVLSGEVLLPAEPQAPPSFRVDWSWRVDGLVSHWGHLHRRRNEYEAEYTVGHDGSAWRITGVEVRQHRRIDLPDPVQEPSSD